MSTRYSACTASRYHHKLKLASDGDRFTFEDSKEGRSKAEAAAARLREVFPGVDATGVSATIPMPGSSIGECSLYLHHWLS